MKFPCEMEIQSCVEFRIDYNEETFLKMIFVKNQIWRCNCELPE